MLTLWWVFHKTFLSFESSSRTKQLSWGVLGIIAVIYILLSCIWYQTPVSFHWFDDGEEWLGMDKIGHFFSTALISRTLIYIFTETGADEERCTRVLSWSGFLLWSPIEYLDGCSAEYGASAWDLLANFMGSAAIYLQLRFLKQVALFPKFSYFPSAIAAVRPALLGATPVAAFLKNYNAQTYWFSIPLTYLFPRWRLLPKWLCISIGYGAEGMTGGHSNAFLDAQGKFHPFSDALRHSQWYLSLDFVPNIKPGHPRIIKSLLYILSVFKFPFPAIEINSGSGVHFHIISI